MAKKEKDGKPWLEIICLYCKNNLNGCLFAITCFPVNEKNPEKCYGFSPKFFTFKNRICGECSESGSIDCPAFGKFEFRDILFKEKNQFTCKFWKNRETFINV